MLELFIFLTAIVVVIGAVWGMFGANDPFHPLTYLMTMIGFFYVYVPISLQREGALLRYFSIDDVTYIQGLSLACVIALALGCYHGSGGVRRDPERVDVFSFTATSLDRQALLRCGILLGIIGIMAYVYQISNVGGFIQAYNNPKGGGWASSGYIRDLDFLLVPAIVCIYLAGGQTEEERGLPLRYWLLVGSFSVPVLIHGLLSSRRGPTFLGIAALVGGWYLARRSRPSRIKAIAGGVAVGVLLLALVAFRGQIYLGSAFLLGGGPATTEVVERSLEYGDRTDMSNEYLHGMYVALNARDHAGHYWGRRYLTQIFVRPIPSSIWPTKYRDVGMEALTLNSGLLQTDDISEHPMAVKGSAPGFAASAYVEWGWGAPVFVFLLGYLYAYMWRQSLVQGGIWTVFYVILMSVSVFFIAQSFYASFFRLLLMSGFSLMFWYMLQPTSRRASNLKVPGAVQRRQGTPS
jgi:hypothetical protein